MKNTVALWLALSGAGLPAQGAAMVLPGESSRLCPSAHLDLGDNAAAVDQIWSGAQAKLAIALADDWIKTRRGDPSGHVLRYLAELELRADRGAALRVANSAIQALLDAPAALTTFVDKALLVDPDPRAAQLALMTIQPLVPDGKKDPIVRVCHVRALLACGKAKEALITNKDIVADLRASPAGLDRLVRAIAGSEHGALLASLARQALDALPEDHAEGEVLAIARFRVLLVFEKQDAKAGEVARRIFERATEGNSLNNWVWYLCTQRETVGRFPEFMRRAAEKLLESGARGSQRDTVALAYFRAGDAARALAEQEKAVTESAPSEGMTRRLELYRAAARRVAAKPASRPATRR